MQCFKFCLQKAALDHTHHISCAISAALQSQEKIQLLLNTVEVLCTFKHLWEIKTKVQHNLMELNNSHPMLEPEILRQEEK